MDVEFVQSFLLYSLAINYGILLAWFLMFAFAKDFLFGLHGRWFRLPPDQFDAIHYTSMAVYKIGIFLFNLVPLIALWLIGAGS
ncbi:DUF6868 family protein [Arenimonas alkanexedens]